MTCLDIVSKFKIDQRYACDVNGQCIENSNGQYLTPNCNNECVRPTHKECLNGQCVDVIGMGQDQCTTNYQCDDLYYVKSSISVFGNYNRAGEQITEFKNFIENNSKLRLNLIINYYPKLQDSEICLVNYYGEPCYAPDPTCLLSDTIQKIPFHQMSNVIMYESDYNQKHVCFAGGCYCSNILNGTHFIAIPYIWDSNDMWGPWSQRGSQRLTHEWMHSLDYKFNDLGYPDFPNLDGICETLGYNDQNDPGWARCYKYFLTLITPDMYKKIEEYNSKL